MFSRQQNLKMNSTADSLKATESLFPFHEGDPANHLFI